MKLTIVIVFYQQKIEQAKTFVSLNKALSQRDHSSADVEIILYDNSLEHQVFHSTDYSGFNITYIHDPRNLGIATAYNYAWDVAKKNESEWLLLFDHDTEVTEEYVKHVMEEHKYDANVVAVVPKVISNKIMISPVYSHTLRPLTIERPVEGLQNKPVMAINSGSLINVNFLTEIGGFNERFSLDYLDHWLFYEIYTKGKKVWLLNVTLQHELSVMDYSEVSLNRYKSIIDSEFLFYSEYKKDLFRAYRKQLAKRLAKQLLLVKNKQIALYTLRQLFK